MALAWYVAPHRTRISNGHRYCAMDDFTPEIFAAGGAWENQGDLALVRAPHRLLRVLPFKKLSEPEAGRLCGDSIGLGYLANKIQKDRPSSEMVQLYNLWAGVGFGQRWRLPRPLCGLLARKGIVPTPLWNLSRVLFDQAGAFPTLGIIDDFNRANEDPVSGGGIWSSSPLLTGGSGAMAVISNQLALSAAAFSSCRLAAIHGPNFEFYVTQAVAAVDGATLWFMVGRLINPNSASESGYFFYTGKAAATDTGSLGTMTNGSNTDLGAAIEQEFSVGDAGGFEVIGNTLAAYRKASGGAWALITTRSSNLYNSAGALGFSTGNNTTVRYDDVGGGTIGGSVLLERGVRGLNRGLMRGLR
jgi:hypothetical protein